MLKLIFILIGIFSSLILLKPSFSQATMEYHIFSKDNPINGAISIEFPDGWNTYWKFPGPNGFTPNIKVLKKQNLKSFDVSWPYPKKLGPKNFTYLGYDDDLLLPVKLEKIDARKSMYLHLDISFGICKSACIVQNKILKISDKSDIDYFLLDKLLKSKNRITMATSFGGLNKCKIKKMTDKEYHITFENHFMKNSETVTGVLVDYEGTSWTIETQSFYPDFGKVEAVLKLEGSAENELVLENFSLLYLDNRTAKRTVGCHS